ncbi:DUF6474 family protein [Gordonia jinhuaensis]|uniref:Uncharacterized protein n=1 Tax=Gordonia jinhuaensis TaxID=1517702 RepID=A0A916WZ41_9ACTN|nr:DUF6474 family protein [Gordonia jinhuaensis]GGB44356.1 hypothetical protein GCM10011489_34800 [Gordonia jinhuaensis]
MGLFTSKRKRKTRSQKRAEAKALKAKAKLEARLSSKNQRKEAKASRKHESKLAKKNAKATEKSDKNALKIAQANAAAAADGKALSPARVKRYLSVARLVAPMVVPIAYRAAMSARDQITSVQASRAGVPVAEYNKFSGHGAALSARIAAADRSLDQLSSSHNDAETTTFVGTMRTRLTDLSNAVGASEHMPPTRRRKAHAAISRELEAIDADLLARLGVRS